MLAIGGRRGRRCVLACCCRRRRRLLLRPTNPPTLSPLSISQQQVFYYLIVYYCTTHHSSPRVVCQAAQLANCCKWRTHALCARHRWRRPPRSRSSCSQCSCRSPPRLVRATAGGRGRELLIQGALLWKRAAPWAFLCLCFLVAQPQARARARGCRRGARTLLPACACALSLSLQGCSLGRLVSPLKICP